jgi:hypothetical protein
MTTTTSSTRGPQPDAIGISELARQRGFKPKDLCDAIYLRLIDERRLIPRGRRRLIPTDYVPEVLRVLQARGKLGTVPIAPLADQVIPVRHQPGEAIDCRAGQAVGGGGHA